MSGQGHPEPRVDGAARPDADREAHAARPGRPERLRRARHLSIRARLTLTRSFHDLVLLPAVDVLVAEVEGRPVRRRPR